MQCNNYLIKEKFIIFHNKQRIFINTSLGCLGKCSYCYLPECGYNNNIKNIKAKEIINYFKNKDIIINENTLITIGCFSKCWDKYNKIETKKVIKYFLKKGNQVQMSTKKKILFKDIKSLLKYIKYEGQLLIYVSSATISKKCKIPIVLYIKPVLPINL